MKHIQRKDYHPHARRLLAAAIVVLLVVAGVVSGEKSPKQEQQQQVLVATPVPNLILGADGKPTYQEPDPQGLIRLNVPMDEMIADHRARYPNGD